MANVELPIFPSKINCLAWSQEGDLAVAAGEYVYILIPNRLKVGDAAKLRENHHPVVGPWHEVHFRVNLFTQDEWPYQETASLDDFSLGEEQSTSIVTGLAWSTPGLALHGRCVLAVSTSNLLVSLWEPRHQPTESSNWYRSCVLNHALRRHISSNSDRKALARRLARIRAVTWSREPPKLNGRWKQLHIIAAVNQDGDLYFLRLNGTRGQKSREAAVLLDLPAKAPVLERRNETPEEKQPEVDQRKTWKSRRSQAAKVIRKVRQARLHLGYTLAWSGWQDDNTFLRSYLVYKHAGIEIYYELACSNPEITDQRNGSCYGQLKLFQRGAPWVQQSVADGPSIWLPKGDRAFYHCVGGGRQLVDLTSCTLSETICDITYLKQSMPSQRDTMKNAVIGDPDRWVVDDKVRDCPPTCHPWESVSGMCAVLSPDQEAFIISIVTHLSTFKQLRFGISSPNAHPNPRRGFFLDEFVPNLQRKMERCRRDFAIAKKLGSLTVMKTWGLASHNDILASIISLHPAEMVEYTTSAQERSIIIFSHSSHEDVPHKPPASFLDFEPKPTPTIKEIGPRLDFAPRRESIDEITFPWERKRTVLSRETAQRSFLQILTFKTLRQAESACLDSAIASFHLVCARFLYGNDMGQFLAHVEPSLTHPDYAKVIAIARLAQHGSNPWGSKSENEAMKIVNDIIQVTERHSPAERQIPVEECIPDCGGCLRWETMGIAFCANGHRWRRCGLSYLAILEPGISKYCETCGAEFRDEGEFPPLEGQGDAAVYDEIRSEFNLVVPCDVRDLFRVQPVCIFCGGMFVRYD